MVFSVLLNQPRKDRKFCPCEELLGLLEGRGVTNKSLRRSRLPQKTIARSSRGVTTDRSYSVAVIWCIQE